ncbi:dihydrofolate reductase family protein [Caenimonas aquaedulcis]|uniref:Dihydrofolate reductase family protein n=1 Tax=Caenimonas aquaedulcis TaxID=2793270 RepID=A0A931H8H3_9BURK|nr:dihydrofolate reductase family protein [Caenimonas aquaedulcis]MBG9390478.1 dihydrofolate reductase family protein [Caenimonas aquaedulcis]
MKVSIDGRSGGADGYAHWVDAWSDDYGLAERVDACLIGGRMYPGYEQYWTAIAEHPTTPLPMTGKPAHADEKKWSAFASKTPHYVLSSTLKDVAWPTTRFVRSLDAVRELQAQPGKAIYAMGGAMLIGTLLEAELLDELHLITYPVLAGPGASPFDHLRGTHAARLLFSRQIGEGRVHQAYQL